jgi:thiamine-phosphate pyrophosphorylase
MRGLYAIVDVDFLETRQISPIAFAERVLAARPAILQLRAKSLGAGATLSLLRALRPLCVDRGVPLFANDRPDLAVLASADGVHVGQRDLSVSDVRRFARSLRVGVSTHTLEELDAALAEKPDYVAFGPVFPTASKERPDPVVGIEGLRAAAERARAASIPLVAIGGLDAPRARLAREHADLVAMISALLPEEGIFGVERRVRECSAAAEGPA